MTSKPTCRINVDFPPMFGPVRITKGLTPLVAKKVSLGMKLSAIIHGCFPSLMSMIT